MATSEKAFQRGVRRGTRALQLLADEFRAQRLGLGLSQASVAAAARLSRSRYTRIEGAAVGTMTVMEAARISSVLGLELGVQAYPGGDPLRDGAHARRLHAFGGHVGRPLTFRREVGLPSVPGRVELRAWDGEVRGRGERTAVELEMRLHDAQAVERRIGLKRRDDPTDHFLLLIADTRHNRGVLAGSPGLLADLPRLRPSRVFRALEEGRHPPTGLLLV
jgi:transcriptional regulator with XRE-family HTH domain